MFEANSFQSTEGNDCSDCTFSSEESVDESNGLTCMTMFGLLVKKERAFKIWTVAYTDGNLDMSDNIISEKHEQQFFFPACSHLFSFVLFCKVSFLAGMLARYTLARAQPWILVGSYFAGTPLKLFHTRNYS